ncbi:MAG: ABC transporter ATP-binding protein [Clostridia bacterium]|nr:ABC transporter ATP-binding protein [Clostridia bacterium]
MELISLRHVSKRYRTEAGEVRALDDVTLSVKRGEFVAVIGRSGSGKSTLMNILGCLDIPSSGQYHLAGRNMSHCAESLRAQVRGRQIGFVFQGFHLIPSLTALENVELPLLYRGFSREERRVRATESLLRVGLSQRMTHRPSELSGGQQQRVAIARAIAATPPLVLTDEPTGNLDSTSGDEVMDILHTLHSEGKTVVLITHDRAIADTAERQICIQDGRVIV